jgi:hypothetical protein
MNRPGAASLHWRTRSGDPFKAPIALWRFASSIAVNPAKNFKTEK